MYVLYNCLVFHVQPEDGHYQAPKHVVVPYVENTSYSTNIYSCVRPVHTLYISYLIEHNGGDKPHDCLHHQSAYTIEQAGSFETSVSIQPT